MPAVDLAAIRRELAHSPRLSAALELLITRVADLEVRLDAANGRTAAKCRELMAARRDVEQARAERDHWVGRFYESVPQRFVLGAHCPTEAEAPPPGAGVCDRCGAWESAPEKHTACSGCGRPWGRIEDPKPVKPPERPAAPDPQPAP